jgi:polysaccharide export outer membrane protein
VKFGSLLIVFLTVTLFCRAQDKVVADQPVRPDTTSSTPADSYVVGDSDVIDVLVWNQPSHTMKDLLVRPDGMISMQLLGDIKASGKTLQQLADEITIKLKKYIQEPNVTVVLSQNNSKKVYLIGEVGRTGPVQLTAGMTLLQAIASAGGITQFANAKKIYILRNISGQTQKIPVQYKKALRGDGSLNLILNQGDTIVVP